MMYHLINSLVVRGLPLLQFEGGLRHPLGLMAVLNKMNPGLLAKLKFSSYSCFSYHGFC